MKFINKNFPILIFICFLVIRIIYIIKIPLFTDESSYIRWGILMIHNPSFLWSSLEIGGRQPLGFWLFGLAALKLNNINIAPRLVSLFFSSISFITIYYWIKLQSSKIPSIISIIIITITPLFIHFQSLAILESPLLCFTIFTLWFTELFCKTHKLKYIILLGVAISIGLWIKTNTLLTTLLAGITLITNVIIDKHHRQHKILMLLVLPATIIIMLFPLFIQPDFHFIFADTNHFTYTIQELFHFPYQTWINNLVNILYCLFIYLGPISIFGLLIYFYTYKYTQHKLYIFWSLFLLLVPLFINKLMNTRYFITAVIPLLPLISIGITDIYKHTNQTVRNIGKVSLLVTLFGGLVLTIYPSRFFTLFPDIPMFLGERNYVFGWTGGYTTKTIVNYLNYPDNLLNKPAILALPDYQGNPTDYIIAQYYNSKDYFVTFLNTKVDLIKLKNSYSQYPIYYISRQSISHDDINNNITLIKTFLTPENTDKINLYKVVNLSQIN
jgi:4-amino-4-deoxy-L-arabinose transferase-like glycosyltransferase